MTASPDLFPMLRNTTLALEPSFALAPRRLRATGQVTSMNRIAIIPVDGILAPMPTDTKEGIRGYGDIRLSLLAALEADDIDQIALFVNSPGGIVAGCFDLADTIYAARGIKPIHAILAEMACSAAYALASSAHTVSVPRTGKSGSIGIVMIHREASQADQKIGIKTTVVRSGAQKMDINEAEPLGVKALARMQAEVDETAAMFFDIVARNRGMSPDNVRNTEGATFFGAHGIDAGLADHLLPPDAAFRRLFKTT